MKPRIHTFESLKANSIVVESTLCWEWQGTISSTGYGQVCVNAKVRSIHRFIYELVNGVIPDGLCVLHHCDNPPCFNPEHLFLGTHLDNKHDCMKKGRMRNASGDDHYTRRKPELVLRGERHWSRKQPHMAVQGEKNPCAKLKKENVEYIRSSFAKGVHTRIELAQMFCVSKTLIDQILRGQIWRYENTGMSNLGLLLPSSGSPTIADTLITTP